MSKIFCLRFKPGSGAVKQIWSLNRDGSDFRLLRKDPHDRLAEDALAASGFPRDSNNLPLPNGQGEIAHGT